MRLEIFNLTGARVAALVDEYRVAGTYTEMWDGRDQHGQKVSSGLYFYRIVTDDLTAIKKMILLQ